MCTCCFLNQDWEGTRVFSGGPVWGFTLEQSSSPELGCRLSFPQIVLSKKGQWNRGLVEQFRWKLESDTAIFPICGKTEMQSVLQQITFV